MNRLLIDTNIVIDLLAKRASFYEEAAMLFSLADKKEIKLLVTSLTFANTNYILTKQKSPTLVREILRKFKVLIEIMTLDDKIIDLALSDNQFVDFEDGLQYYSAMENNADVLITRNKRDFKNSKIPVLTAKEYLSRAH